MIRKNVDQQLDERELWDKIRSGNKDSLSSLFSLYYPCLYNYGYKIAPKDQFIKDCIQELFLTIWEQRNTISQVYSVKSYMYVSMKRMIFNNLKKYRNYKKRNVQYAEEFQEDSDNFDTSIIAQEFQREYKMQLDEALRALSNRQKEVIKLKYSDGLSNSEIANFLEINRQSVYNHVSEALKQLKINVQNTPQAYSIESSLLSASPAYS